MRGEVGVKGILKMKQYLFMCVSVCCPTTSGRVECAWGGGGG